jgi:cytochrome P450 family 6
MSPVFLFTIALIIFTAVYFWIRKKLSYFEDKGILHEKPVFPLGNLKGAGKEFHIANKIRENYEKFKGKSPFFGMYFFINANYIITDLDLVKSILVKDFDSFRNRGLYHNEVDDPLTGKFNQFMK